MDKMIRKIMGDGEKKAPVKSIKIKFQKPKRKSVSMRHILKYKKRRRVAFSPGKAKGILREVKPTLRGHAITPAQRRWLGWQAGGAKKKRVVGAANLMLRMGRHKQGSGKRFKLFKESFAKR